MNRGIRIAQVTNGFVVRCPIHGDIGVGSKPGTSPFPNRLQAELNLMSHAVFVFHGEGAR